MMFIYEDAIKIAERAVGILAPLCNRIEIAGSLRRKRPQVKDIEIVCIPTAAKLFGFVEAVNHWERVKGQPTGKYTQRILPEGIKLDLFICQPETWACNFLIRTGSAEFSHRIVTYAWSHCMKFKNARLWYVEGKESSSPTFSLIPNIIEERDVFKALKMPWIEPENRDGWQW